MGKAEVEPVAVPTSESESDSDTTVSLDDSVDEVEMAEHVNMSSESFDEYSPRSRPRHKSNPPKKASYAMYMIAPWAPLPFMRRSWTPDRSCPQGQNQPNKKGQPKRRRCQSVPQPSCSAALPPQQKWKSRKVKASKDVQKAVHRWLRWQAFMKFLMDEDQIDNGVIVEQDGDAEVCDSFAPRSAHTSDEEQGPRNLTWDDNPYCTNIANDSDTCSQQESPCVMAYTPRKVEELKLTTSSGSGDKQQHAMENGEKVFLQMVRQLGPRRWMFNVLANHKIAEAREVDKKMFAPDPVEEKCVTEEKRNQFRDMIREMGPDSWMVKTLVQEMEITNKSTGRKEMKSPDPTRVRFRQVVCKLGPAQWMLRVMANQGVPNVEDSDVSVFKKPVALCDAATPEKREELRKVIKDIGPQPWMVKVVINQAKSIEEIKTFRRVVLKLGPAPWMLRVMINNGVPNVGDADISAFKKPGTSYEAPTPELRKELRTVIKQIGPKPWMVRVVINQANIAWQKGVFRETVVRLGPAPWMLRVMANNGVQKMQESHMTTVKKHSTHDGVTCEKREELRRVVKELGPKPWMVNIVVNQAKLLSKIKQENLAEERKVFRETVVKLGPASWMLEEMVKNGVPDVDKADVSIFKTEDILQGTPSTEQRQELSRVINKNGPRVWMSNVVLNQAKMTVAKKNFQQMVVTVGPKPWMFKVLGNNGVPEAKGVDVSNFRFSSPEEECEMKVKRQQFRRLVVQLGPKPWMLKILIHQCNAYTQKMSSSDSTEAAVQKNDAVEKRREFRQIVREMKPGSWMLRVLANNGVQEAKDVQYPGHLINEMSNVDEKRKEFRSIIKKLGPKPWMMQVIINQAKAMSQVTTEKKNPLPEEMHEVISESEIKSECEKTRKKRRAFTEMVRQMGPKQWMVRVLFNQGLRRAEEVKLSTRNLDDEMTTKQKREEFRQFIKSTGPKPWMLKVVVNQSRILAEEKVNEQTTEDEKVVENVKAEMVNNRQEFGRTVRQMGPRPWMLKVLANHGIAEASIVDNSIFTHLPSCSNPVTQQMRREFRQMIRRIGPAPWMVNVIKNQASKIGIGENGDGTDSAISSGQRQKDRKRFREVIEEIGAKPWMLQVVRNQLKKAENKNVSSPNQVQKPYSQAKEENCKSEATEMEASIHKEQQLTASQENVRKGKRKTSKVTAANQPPPLDDSDESDDDFDVEQMGYMYQELIRQMMRNPSMAPPYMYNY